MRSPQYIPSFYFYKFANAVAAPYTSLDAYRSGAIDENGNIIATEGSIDDFEYFVIKLKKIFEDLPPGITKSRLTNVVGLFQLFAEEVESIGVTQEQVVALTEAHVILNSNNQLSLIELLEDMGTAGMSTGSAPGELGTPADAPEANKGNVSGYDPRMGEILTRNQPVNMFQGIEMFNVSPEEFKKFKQSKAWRHLPDSPTKKYLQRFQRRNKEGKMAVRDEASGDIFFIPYKEKTFMEEFGLQGLNILRESGTKTVQKVLDNSEDIEINSQTVRDTTDMLIDRANKERNKDIEKAKEKNPDVDPRKVGLRSGTVEAIGALDDLAKSMPAVSNLLRSVNPNAQRLAANWHGGFRSLNTRSSSNDPTGIDSIRAIEVPPQRSYSHSLVLPNSEIDSNSNFGIAAVGQRGRRATAPMMVKHEEWEDLPGYPKQAMDDYAAQINTATDEALDSIAVHMDSFFSTPEAQKRASELQAKRAKESGVLQQVSLGLDQGSFDITPEEQEQWLASGRGKRRFRRSFTGSPGSLIFQPKSLTPEAQYSARFLTTPLTREQRKLTTPPLSLIEPFKAFGGDVNKLVNAMKRLRQGTLV